MGIKYTIHYTYSCQATQITDTQCTHTNMDSTSGLTLLPTLPGQGGGPLYMLYMCTGWIPPAAGLRHPFCPVAGLASPSAQFLSPGYTTPLAPRPLHLLAG